jgi:hypothetical protein
MVAIYGLALICASVVILLFVAKIRNAPGAAAWASSKVLLQAVLFSTMTAFIFGISMVFGAIADYPDIQFGGTESGIAAAIIAATILAWRKIRRLGSSSAAPGRPENAPPTANTNDPKVVSVRKAGRTPTRAA